jgi:2-iminobutanoate/2-iminopropanoate deaminase
MPVPVFHMVPKAPLAVAPYSHAVERDGWLFVTGQLPVGTDPSDEVPEGIEAQTRKTMANLQIVLDHLGYSFADVLSVRVYLTKFKRDYAPMNRVYSSYFAADRLPARTCVGVTALARDCLVEIDMVARKA